jgi:mono/diheme cytochrome c family protein
MLIRHSSWLVARIGLLVVYFSKQERHDRRRKRIVKRNNYRPVAYDGTRRNCVALFLIAGLTASACVAPVYAETPDSSDQDAAAKIFAEKCEVCHGKNGTGDTSVGKILGAANLTSAKVQAEPDAQLAVSIAEGKNRMPAFKTMLTEQQIQDLLRYVRQFGKKGRASN